MKQYLTKQISNNYLILLILLLGLCLRIYGIGSESLWLDEAYSERISHLGPVDMIKTIIDQEENNPPFYYVLLHYWTEMFGNDEFSLRLLSVLFGSMSILLIYSLGSLIVNKNVGLAAALILALSLFQVKYSQEARCYTLLLFLTLSSYYSLLKLMWTGKLKYSMIYILSGAIIIYTHHYGALILVSQNIYYFTKYFLSHRVGEISLKRWILYQLILFLVFIPELLLIKEASSLHEGFWIPKPNVKVFFGTVLEYSGSTKLFVLYSIFALVGILKAVPLKQFAGIRDSFSSRECKTDAANLPRIEAIYLLLILLFILNVIPFLVSIFITPIYGVRYTIAGSMAFYLLVAIGIEATGNNTFKLFIIGLLALLSIYPLHRYYKFTDKQQWRDAVHYIENNAKPGDNVMVYPAFETISAEYYSKINDLKILPPDGQNPVLIESNGKDFWVLLSDTGGSSTNTYESALLKNHRVLLEKDFNRLKVYKFTRQEETGTD